MTTATDSLLGRLADVLVGYSGRVRKGDLVVISAPTLAADLVQQLYERVIEAGAFPALRISVEDEIETLLEYGSTAQLEWENPVRMVEVEEADLRVAIEAEWNSRSLTGVDPARQASYQRAGDAFRRRFFERAAAGELRWVVTTVPTQSAAQDADMSLAEYERFLCQAAFLDEGDPVQRWEAFARELDQVRAFLSEQEELRIVADGTDLRIAFEGRTWVISDGRENFPDGEVFTGPVEASVEGTIRFTYPAVFQRREVHDVRLRFEGGRVVEASAARGEAFLRQVIALDEGAGRVGEFAFGLNPAIDTFTRNTLLDEKIGGSVHLALGQSYPETGGRNQSALHWDMICDLRRGGEVYADEELVYRDGTFLPGVL